MANSGEEWARRIVEKNLGRPVLLYDDGKERSMYDLLVGTKDVPEIAIECVGAVDSAFTETWNMGPARGPIKVPLTSNWWIIVRPSARGAGIQKIKKRAAALLQELESRDILEVSVNTYLEQVDPELFAKLDSLSIDSIRCYQVDGNGTVQLSMDGMGGVVDTKGNDIPTWISEFLRASSQSDVLSKLAAIALPVERHAFVIVAFRGAQWSVESYLMHDIEEVPDCAPDLPYPVTGVWIAGSMGRQGIRWDGKAWSIFAARGEGIEVGSS